MNPKRVAIIGGGISGLTAAYTLAQARRSGAPVEEYLFEASPRLGGALRTEHVDGFLIEAGADSFLTEKRDALELCEKLGLVAQLVGSEDEHRRTLILHRGKLTPLPEGFEFLVPGRLLSVLGTPLLSLRDKLALGSELFRRPRGAAKDESVANFIYRHFGRDLLENVVEPLLGAVYGGDPHRLSVQATLPRLVEVERRWGSLVRGLRQAARERKKLQAQEKNPPGVRPPLFTTLRDGVETLVAALRMNLEESRVFCERRVQALARQSGPDGTGFQLRIQGQEAFAADAVVVALPAREAAGLVRELDPRLAGELREIPYSSSLIVAVGYAAEQVPRLPSSFGFLVPRREGRRLRACSFVGQKFRHRVPANRVLFRCFLGGALDEAAPQMSEAEATRTVRQELEEILGVMGEPLLLKQYRWPKALAQYTVGHLERYGAVRARLARQRGLFLCGNAYEGIGVPDCIRSGRLAAEACWEQLQES